MKTRCTHIHIIFLVLLCIPGMLRADDIRVSAVAEKNIYLGEPFQFQIVLRGYAGPGRVDTKPLQPWSPVALQGIDRSSRSITIINGRRSEQVRKLYVMPYQLFPVHAGPAVIPSLSVEISGKIYKTKPVSINVMVPQSSEYLHLEIILSRTKVYVGEPVTVTVNWYVPGLSVRDVYFNLPILSDDSRFQFEDAPLPPGITRGDLFRVNVNGRELIAWQHRGNWNSKACSVITFKQILIPQQAGHFRFPASNINCSIDVSGRRQIPGFFFDDDFFGTRRQYRRFTTRADAVTLDVKALPAAGRPADFSGLIGSYKITASASPTEDINIGDPVTLKIIISGDLLKPVTMPDLQAIPEISRNFKISSQEPLPVVKDGKKIFKRILRPNNDKVKRIPPIPLSFFDVTSGKYRTIYSKSIPLKILPTRLVTADQAQGLDYKPRTTELEVIHHGMAANIYDQRQLLQNTAFTPRQSLTQPGILALLILPFLLFVATAAIQLIRRDNPQKQQARQRHLACRRALTRINNLPQEQSAATKEMADIIRQYVGDRHNRPYQTLTAQDCRALLGQTCSQTQLVDELCSQLERLEQSLYTGNHTDSNFEPQKLKTLIKQVDKHCSFNGYT